MCLSVSTKEPLQIYKKKDDFNKVNDSDMEPGPFCDIEDI